MKAINLKPFGKREISFYLALEEYVLENFSEDVFFLWDLNPSIIIGKNQLIHTEVNMAYAEKQGVKVYRRPSGGGAIYADQGCFMFTFVTKENQKDQIFQTYLAKMTEALKQKGVEACFSGRNDLLYLGKKFSGNAMYRTEHGSVLHGTFLYDTDLAELVRMITPDNEKLISKGIKSVSERVINLKDAFNISKDETMDYLIQFMGDTVIELTQEEFLEVAQRELKFQKKEWIYGNNPNYTFQAEERFSWGKLSLRLDFKKNKIKEITMHGDYFEQESIEPWKEALIGVEWSREEIQTVLEKYPISQYIIGSSNQEILTLLFGA